MVSPGSHAPQPLAAAVTVLQTLYGQPSQAGFGSAVFEQLIEPGTDLEVNHDSDLTFGLNVD